MENLPTVNTRKKSAASHDLFFKDIFSHIRFAQELFQLFFSKEEMKLYDWSSLKEEKDTFKHKRADLVFSVPFKGGSTTKAFIFLLLEHKSKIDPTPLFLQLLEYQVFLYLQSYKTTEQLVPVIPLVFYHGKAPWKGKGRFQENFEKSVFSRKFERFFREDVLNFRIRIVDIRAPGMERKFQTFKSRLAFELLRDIWDFSSDDKTLAEIFKFVANLSWKDKKSLIISADEYLMRQGVSRKKLEAAERQALKAGILNKGGFMGLLEYTKLEQWEKGLRKGRQEGKRERDREVILKMLQKKMDVSFIAEVTGLSEKEILKLKEKS